MLTNTTIHYANVSVCVFTLKTNTGNSKEEILTTLLLKVTHYITFTW